MIERYSIPAPITELMARFQLEDSAPYKPKYNAAPSHLLPVITHESPQGLSYFYWGVSPQWGKNKTVAERLINTRVEHIEEKPMLRKNLKRYRCLIPADGFFAWKKVGKKTSIPWRFIPKQKNIISFPGLWEEYEDSEGNAFHTFSIITTAANKDVVEVTERMPIIFTRTEELIWLNKESTEEILVTLLKKNTYVDLDGFTVSPGIKSPDAESALLIRPTPASDQFGNLTLFD
ncbi:MAG: SOS response-associated peptidase [Cyclobacteriaceae bacterium]|nr:SOS response-associated peptidase [Cyclobacteriaceae bacterium]